MTKKKFLLTISFFLLMLLISSFKITHAQTTTEDPLSCWGDTDTKAESCNNICDNVTERVLTEELYLYHPLAEVYTTYSERCPDVCEEEREIGFSECDKAQEQFYLQ